MSCNLRATVALSALIVALSACSGRSGSVLPQTPVGESSTRQIRLGQGPDAGAVEFAYVANIGSSNISGYSINATTGALKQIHGSPFGAGLGASAVAIDASGKFAYDTDSVATTVSAFKIDATTGALKAVKGSPFAAGTAPSAVAADPKGKFLYVANYGSDNISAFSIDGSTGALKAVKGSPFSAGSSPIAIGVNSRGHVRLRRQLQREQRFGV